MRITFSRRAQSDVECIYALICQRRGEEAADFFLNLTKGAIRLLASQPLAGPHPSWAKRHKSIRFWIIGKTNFLIYYLVDNDGISIERILDGRRNVARIIERAIEDPDELED